MQKNVHVRVCRILTVKALKINLATLTEDEIIFTVYTYHRYLILSSIIVSY